jgi:RNA 3'-terminal phosphate cyclase (ATP)
LGKLGLPAEEIAEIACQEFFDFDRTGAPVNVHLADQLLLPAALATGSSQYRVAEISSHLTTNAWVVEQFGLAKIDINEADLEVSISRSKP